MNLIEKLPTLTVEELIEMLVALSEQKGGARCRATDARDAKTRGRQWAMVKEIESRQPLYLAEVYRRLGVDVPVTLTNRPAFVYLAASRHNRLCEQCNDGGGLKSRFLNWIAKDGMPLPLVQAMHGAEKSAVQAAVQICRLLCRRCAMAQGTKFLKSGKPDLKEFR